MRAGAWGPREDGMRGAERRYESGHVAASVCPVVSRDSMGRRWAMAVFRDGDDNQCASWRTYTLDEAKETADGELRFMGVELT